MRDPVQLAAQEALERLRDRARALVGPPDVVGMFHDTEDFPDFDADPDSSYDRGLIEGMACALGLTAIELLDELGVA